MVPVSWYLALSAVLFSMGELLMISLAWTLVTTLFVSPALLGPPPPREQRAHEKLI